MDDDYLREDPADHPENHYPEYVSTRLRAPSAPPVRIPQTLTETTAPDDWEALMGAPSADLTRQHAGEAIGQRIIVSGRVLDQYSRPVSHSVIEIWQANAAGRYSHGRDNWDAPLDPNFTGMGRVLTDERGFYRFTTIRPGAYPWGNHDNAWRPAHIHFSLFGPAFVTRLITQMYFPGDPLLALDPIYRAVPEAARTRLVSRFEIGTTIPHHALGYRFDIVLRGRASTPMEEMA